MRGMMKVIAVLAVCIVLSLCDAEPHPANHHARKNHAGKGVAKGKGAAPKAVIPKLALKGAEKAHKKGKQQAHKVVAPKVDAGVLNKIMVELEEMTKSLPALQGQVGLEEEEKLVNTADADKAGIDLVLTKFNTDCAAAIEARTMTKATCVTAKEELMKGLAEHIDPDGNAALFTDTGLAHFGDVKQTNAGLHIATAIKASSDLAGALGALASGTAAAPVAKTVATDDS